MLITYQFVAHWVWAHSLRIYALCTGSPFDLRKCGKCGREWVGDPDYYALSNIVGWGVDGSRWGLSCTQSVFIAMHWVHCWLPDLQGSTNALAAPTYVSYSFSFSSSGYSDHTSKKQQNWRTLLISTKKLANPAWAVQIITLLCRALQNKVHAGGHRWVNHCNVQTSNFFPLPQAVPEEKFMLWNKFSFRDHTLTPKNHNHGTCVISTHCV